MSKRILVTGSRNYTDRGRVAAAIADHYEPGAVVIHGSANGADRLAQSVCDTLGIATEQYPADWDSHGRAAGPMRNQVMVDLGADVCLAFPLGESRGTMDCIRRAHSAGIHVEVFG